jgi:putative colanic acid biosynthesis UDP-glucose lipid carrier transferase
MSTEVPQSGLMREVQIQGRSTPGNGVNTLENPTGGASTTRLLTTGSIRQTSFRLGTTAPLFITALKELLGPSVVVATLAGCAWADHARLSSEFFALAVLAFLLSERLLSAPELHMAASGKYELRPALPRLLLEWGAIFALFTFLTTALRLTRWIGSGALTGWLLVTPPALMVSDFAAIRLARWWAGRRPGPYRHIIIGATEAGLELAKRVRQGSCSGRFLGFFDFRDPSRLPLLASGQWAGTCTGVANFIQRNGVDAVYIALPISTAPRIADLLRQLRDTTASIYLVPANIFEFNLVQPRCMEIHGIPALAICETPHRGMPGLRKRIVDVALSVLALLFAGPVMLVIAGAVKLTSRGPVLFRQRRYGLRGEEIFIYKFRSMTVCEDGPAITQATRNDCRTTTVGRFLRRTSLDELPQVLNVLEGKMSFVGPRPHAVAHNEQYRKLISGYMIRHKVRPGITGWAQVNGLRGETDTLDKMRRRIEYDIDYLNNWSLWLDLKILLRTAVLVLRDDHAY